LHLYISGQADLAVHYLRRAVGVRPESKAANLNLATALAQRHGASAPPDVVNEIIDHLTISAGGTKPDPQKFNKEKDFDALLQNPQFATWARGSGGKTSSTKVPGAAGGS